MTEYPAQRVANTERAILIEDDADEEASFLSQILNITDLVEIAEADIMSIDTGTLNDDITKGLGAIDAILPKVTDVDDAVDLYNLYARLARLRAINNPELAAAEHPDAPWTSREALQRFTARFQACCACDGDHCGG